MDTADVLNNIYSLIGDTPVSEQIGIALNGMAKKDHFHDCYALLNEFIALKKRVDELEFLVGDTPVSTQINEAIK
jgi:hypothetical protein